MDYFFRTLSTTASLKYTKSVNNRPSAKVSLSSTLQETVQTSSMKDSKSLESANTSSNSLLEKLIAGLSSDIHQKNRVYKNDLVRVINKVKDLEFSTKRQGLLLIRCCTELLPDETPSARMELVELIWNTIK